MTNINQHLHEIKLRLSYFLFSTFCTFWIFYHYKIEIVYIIGRPFVNLQQTFIFLELTEAFYTLLKISILLSFLLVIPLLFYQFWSFLVPSFYKLERRRINFYFSLIFCLWVSELLIIYFIFLPKICHFLISFEMISDFNNSSFYLQPIISVEFSARFESYVKLIIKISSLFFLLFQIPFCVCVLYSKQIIAVSSLYHNRKFLGLSSLILSALIVPPDLFSQLIVAIFFYVLFEFLILLGLFF